MIVNSEDLLPLNTGGGARAKSSENISGGAGSGAVYTPLERVTLPWPATL